MNHSPDSAEYTPRQYQHNSRSRLVRTPRVSHVIAHAFGCGARIPCPIHGLIGPYNPAERLRNGDTVAHDCGRTWRPAELPEVAR